MKKTSRAATRPAEPGDSFWLAWLLQAMTLFDWRHVA